MTDTLDLNFSGTPDVEWALSVAEHFRRAAHANDNPYLTLAEIWIAPDLALYVRHVRMNTRLGVRYGHLGIDPTSGGPARSSAQQGSYLYHTIYDTPEVRDWRDGQGYEWWGDRPATTWDEAVSGHRLTTFDLN